MLAAALALILSCSSHRSDTVPVANLASTTSAGREFARIREKWTHNDPAERVALRADLEAFTKHFPRDGLVPLAQVYRILSLMDPPDDYPLAGRLLDAQEPPPHGSTRDLYTIAEAKLLRMRHEPEAAFDLLRPLVGKMIESRARGLLQEELTLDALESHQPYEAIAYMDAWLRGATEEDRQAAEAKVAVALAGVPQAALRGSLVAMREGGASHGYGVAIGRLVAERLAKAAIEGSDVSLARWLLDVETVSRMLDEETAGQLAALATSKRGIGSVAGRTLGVVLPTSSAGLRDEAADVLRGILWALEVARGDGGADAIRLVTRDDVGDGARLVASLEDVAGEGATVIITALDAKTAAAALAWGANQSLSIITLASPPVRPPPPYGFVVGEDWSAELEVLATALAGPGTGGQRPLDVATVADEEDGPSLSAVASSRVAWRPPVSCDTALVHAGESRFPVATWAKEGVHSWLVAADPACAAELLLGVGGGGRGTVALTLEASEIVERSHPGTRVVSATTGVVPLALAPSGDPRVADVRAMTARTGAAPRWWAAVGRDAAVLARQALAELPTDTITDPDGIARRRAQLRAALLGARASLWTSERNGFDEAGVLNRTIRTQDLTR
jgi:hypothetical protein